MERITDAAIPMRSNVDSVFMLAPVLESGLGNVISYLFSTEFIQKVQRKGSYFHVAVRSKFHLKFLRCACIGLLTVYWSDPMIWLLPHHIDIVAYLLQLWQLMIPHGLKRDLKIKNPKKDVKPLGKLGNGMGNGDDGPRTAEDGAGKTVAGKKQEKIQLE